jgi:hypothetical protein
MVKIFGQTHHIGKMFHTESTNNSLSVWGKCQAEGAQLTDISPALLLGVEDLETVTPRTTTTTTTHVMTTIEILSTTIALITSIEEKVSTVTQTLNFFLIDHRQGPDRTVVLVITSIAR